MRVLRWSEAHLRQASLRGVVSEARERFTLPAVAIAVMNPFEILVQQVQGIRVVGKADEASLDDYFHIGSCSKSVLAVVAARLVEQQKIGWNTCFFDVLPELEATANPAYAAISLEDLLLCRAGIKPYTRLASEPVPKYGPEVENQRLEFITSLVQQPPSSRRSGGKFAHLYSNASYTMASAMLERVSGMSYEALVPAILREEAGLAVQIGWPNSLGPEQPWGHMISRGRVESFGPDHPYALPQLLAPAGDLSMTPKAYAEYTRLHLLGLKGGDNLISADSYRRIHFAQKGFSLGAFNGRVLGEPYSGFDGTAGTFFCRSLIFPESDFAFTIMTNAGTAKGTMRGVEWMSRQIAKQAFHLRWWERLVLAVA